MASLSGNTINMTVAQQRGLIHRKLLTKICEYLVVGEPHFNNFIELTKTYEVPRNILAQNDLLKIFDSLEIMQLLSPGNYETLKTIARNSSVLIVLTFIDEAEKEIQMISNQDPANLIHTVLQHDLIIYYRTVLSKVNVSPLTEEEGYTADFFDIYVKPDITIPSNPRSKGQSHSTPLTFHDKLNISPLTEEEEYTENIFDISVKPTLRFVSEQRSKRQSHSKPLTFHDIFTCKECQNIYILSPAGCGKTAFAKYLALIWCQAHLPIKSNNHSFIEEDVKEMRKFQLLFFVFLRDEHEQECDVDIMIQNQLLPNLANSTTYTELGLKFLQNLLSNVKCIIILDGLDEWTHPSGNRCTFKNKHIPHNRPRPQCTTLTTSRPWKLDVVRLKANEVDQKLELNGLEGDLLTELIHRVVKQMNEVGRKEKNAIFFIQKLHELKLDALSKNPVIVMQLLTLWYDDKPFGKSQCEIYTNMVGFLLERHFKKQHNDCQIENRNVVSCSSYKKIPVCFQGSVHCKTHVDLLSKLGVLAFDTLFGDNQESSLVFDVPVVKKYLSDGELNICLKVGILTQEKVTGKISERQSNVSFLHKTFQEFFTALYVTINPGKQMSIIENIKCVCSSIEKILEMSQICLFLSGLCPEVMSQLCEHLRDTVSVDSRTRDYRASCKLGAGSSEGVTLVRIQDTVRGWFSECCLNGHETHATDLPLSDFFIGPVQWPAEFKSLTINNPVCSLWVADVYGNDYTSREMVKDILNSVTVFKSIQKLWLDGVPEAFVDQLVSQLKDSLSVEPKTWRYLE